MNLYDRLKDKNKFELLGKNTPYLYADCVDAMQRVDYEHNLKLTEATNIFWLVYPTGVFNLTKLYNLFELIK
jgi:hypothetical protein